MVFIFCYIIKYIYIILLCIVHIQILVFSFIWHVLFFYTRICIYICYIYIFILHTIYYIFYFIYESYILTNKPDIKNDAALQGWHISSRRDGFWIMHCFFLNLMLNIRLESAGSTYPEYTREPALSNLSRIKLQPLQSFPNFMTEHQRNRHFFWAKERRYNGFPTR